MTLTTFWIQLLIKAYKSELSLGIISKLYRGINNLDSDSTKYFKSKWEREGKLALTKNGHIYSTYLIMEDHNVTCLEGILLFFITPCQSAHYSLGKTGCWRSCGGHYHVFWDCPVLHKYWTEINRALQTVFDTAIPLDFKSTVCASKLLPWPQLEHIGGRKEGHNEKLDDANCTNNQGLDRNCNRHFKKWKKLTFGLNLKMDLLDRVLFLVSFLSFYLILLQGMLFTLLTLCVVFQVPGVAGTRWRLHWEENSLTHGWIMSVASVSVQRLPSGTQTDLLTQSTSGIERMINW